MGIPRQLRELHLFAGAGGGILGGILCGHRPVCAVEIEPYCRQVLLQSQRDGILPKFPIWDDVRTFDGTPWRGQVDVICGGFPCQDISSAGKGEGITGERSGLWKEFSRIIGEVRPRFVFVENSPRLVSLGLGVVLGDLAELGYDAEWGVVSAENTGAPHQRKRIWILAYAQEMQRNGCGNNSGEFMGREQISEFRNCSWPQDVADPNEAQCKGGELPIRKATKYAHIMQPGRWGRDPATIPDSGVVRVADELADGVDRLSAIGNGQVPIVAATAWQILKSRIDSTQ